ncbi:MAG: EAL domain-containing protein [Acidobacteria bacterium]|nr:EAL domain-containing protein [Acidobacteriota bacterium]
MKELENLFKKFLESNQPGEVLDCCIVDGSSETGAMAVVSELKEATISAIGQSTDRREREFQGLGYRYYQSGSPVANLIAVLNFFHRGFLHTLSELGMLDRYWSQVDDFFDDLKNFVTKGYLLKDLDELEYVFMSEFKDKMDISPHMRWIQATIQSIRDDKRETTGSDATIKAKLDGWLSKPETRLLLGDEIEWVQILHRAIQQLALAMTQDMRSRNYLQMFILAKELGKKTLYFLHTLGDLYISFIQNREKRLVDFLHLAVSGGEVSHVTVLTVVKFDALTRIWGDTVQNIILEKIENHIENTLAISSPGAFFVEGRAGRVYIFHTGRFGLKLEGKIRKLKARLEEESISFEGNTIGFQVSLATVGFQRGEKLSRDLIKKVLAFVTTRAALTEDGFYYLDAEDKRAVINGIIRNYQQIQFVQSTLNEKNIQLHFQPVVMMESREVYNLEALARIVTPDAVISAKDFIQTVYDLGMILKLDSLVFEKICEYQDRIRTITDKIFLNVSPYSLKSAGFRNILKNTVRELKHAGLSLTVELTEQAVLENVDVIRFINENYGIRFAIDDFGTGYSSLHTVASLSESGAVGYLKVDGEMVRQMENSQETYKVVNTIIRMSDALRLKAIPEYVETRRISQRLLAMGVKMGQGNYFCPASAIEDLIAK